MFWKHKIKYIIIVLTLQKKKSQIQYKIFWNETWLQEV